MKLNRFSNNIIWTGRWPKVTKTPSFTSQGTISWDNNQVQKTKHLTPILNLFRRTQTVPLSRNLSIYLSKTKGKSRKTFSLKTKAHHPSKLWSRARSLKLKMSIVFLMDNKMLINLETTAKTRVMIKRIRWLPRLTTWPATTFKRNSL